MCWIVSKGFDGTFWVASFGRKYKEFNTYEEAKMYAREKNSELYSGGKLNEMYKM